MFEKVDKYQLDSIEAEFKWGLKDNSNNEAPTRELHSKSDT